MKYFAILEPASEKFIELSIKKFGINPNEYVHTNHPQEDFLLVSEKYPIFVVADGVTLIQYILDKKPYPNPSPAGDVARIFCQEFIKVAEEKYESFEESDLKEFFKKANAAVGKYNADHGRTKETVNFWDNDFYAATAGFVIIKDGLAYWGTICDSYVMRFDKSALLLSSSPQCHDLKEVESEKYEGDPDDRKARTIFAWSKHRNKLDSEGKRVGYGVVTGEPEAENYLSTGTFLLQEGELVAILTDGFEDYAKLHDFAVLFKSWPQDLESQVKNLTKNKSEQDPETFGHERSIIFVKND